MIKRNNISMLSHRFSIAPMMDWTESSSFSIGYKAVCARRVHREIENNLVTANVSKADGMVGQTGIAAETSHLVLEVENVTPSVAPRWLERNRCGG